MRRLRVGILFGGRCEEHPVSLKSAREVARHLHPDAYEPFWIGITTAGEWRLCDRPDDGWQTRSRPAVVSPDRETHGLLVLDGGRPDTVRLDVVVPVLHGRYGEDGSIQGLLELSGIPYVGCDIAGSAVCFDKALAYRVATAAGVAVPEHRVLVADEMPDPDELTYPVFVKPARSGSSFGVSKVSGPDDLPDALGTARRYDCKVLVEQAVAGREIGCAVLGERFGLVTGEVDQVVLSHGFFRIHQEQAPETGSDNATFVVPADIPPAVRTRVQQTAKAIYLALGCKGLARVDTFLTDDGTVVLNEVNTLPGLTTYSRYPRMMAAAGIGMTDLLDRLIAQTMFGKKR